MLKKYSLLVYPSLLLWFFFMIIALLQIPLNAINFGQSKGFNLNNKIMVYRTESDDQEAFIENYKNNDIEFEIYKDTNYAGLLTSDSFWFKIDSATIQDFIDANKNEQKLIEIGKPQLDAFTFYRLDQNRHLIEQKTYGRSLPFSQRDYHHRNYFIPLSPNEQSADILFYVKTNSYLQFPVKLWHLNEWVERLNSDLIGHGLFYGALLIMLMYNAVLGFAIRDKNYIFFSLLIVSYGLLQATWDGFGYQFFWPNAGDWDLKSNPIFINLVSLSLLGFTVNFLRLFEMSKRIKNTYLFVMILHGLAIALVFLLPSSTGVYLAMFNSLCTFIICLLAIVVKKFKSKSEVIYLLAWQFFFATNLLNILAGFRVLPYTTFIAISPKIAIIGLISLFSLALSEKLNTVEYLRGMEIEKRLLLKNLHEMHIRISSAKDIHLAFDYLLDMFYDITEYEDGQIIIFSHEKKLFDVYTQKNKNIDCIQVNEERYDLIYNEMAETKMLSQDSLKQLDFIDLKDMLSIDIIPLINLNHPIGFILLLSKEKVIVDDATSEVIIDFATQIAITIDNTRLLNSVTYQARHDFLTKACNRRYFFELAQEVVDSCVNEEFVATIMIDVDDFKKVNDLYGHLVGDEVLIKCVEKIQAVLGDEHILGRYGGEEFIVLIKASEKDSVYELAHRILKAFQIQPIRIEQSEDTLLLEVTVSMGISFSDKKQQSLFALTDAADIALYQAKSKGKNQIVTFEGQ